jgi:hypothetical protein
MDDLGKTALRSDAIRKFCEKAGISGSMEAAGLPDDVKLFRAQSAISTRRLLAHIRPDVSFDVAFAEARSAGVEQFQWRGNNYTTDKADDPKPDRDRAIVRIVELQNKADMLDNTADDEMRDQWKSKNVRGAAVRCNQMRQAASETRALAERIDQFYEGTSVDPTITINQPSEILPGDPREAHLLVGSWATQWETIPQYRLRLALDQIIPKICGTENG